MTWITNLFQSAATEQVVGWVGIALIALFVAWQTAKKAWPAFRNFVRALSRGIKLVDTLATLPDDIAFIKHELEDNHGGSVKDAVKRTELAVASVQADLTHVRGQTAALKTSLAKTNRRLNLIGAPSDDSTSDPEARLVRVSSREGSADDNVG